jgi:hypothetical protein
MRLPVSLIAYLRLGLSFEICATMPFGGCEVSTQGGELGCNNTAGFPQHGTTSRQNLGAERLQRCLAFRQPGSRVDPATLQQETDRSQARNHRAAQSRSRSRGRRGDAGRGGLHAAQARSHRGGGLRASSLRSRPQHPAKEQAAYFPRERADVDDRIHAKRLPPKLNVPRSNWSAVPSFRFLASGNLLVVTCA